MSELFLTSPVPWHSLPLWAQSAIRPDAVAGWQLYVYWAIWLGAGFFGAYPGIVAYTVWAERKLAGRFQDRIGPNRVGPFGLLQPIADALKLVTKENIVPKAADRWVHLLAPVLLLVSAFLAMAVVPVGFGWKAVDPATGGVMNAVTGLVPVDLPSGLLYLIAVSSMSSLGIFLAGWSSRNKYSLLGGMRSVAQLVSYEVPQVLATVPIILWTGSLSLVAILNRQLDLGWYLFSPPGIIAFFILTIANIAEVNRAPFDLPEAESEIIAGYHTEYSGMRFGLFFLAEYLSVFAVSCLGTTLFLGGGSTGIPAIDAQIKGMLTDRLPSFLIVNGITVGIFFTKVILYIFVMFWVRATLPRLRVDRLMNFAWKFLVPLSILNILVAAIWQECLVGHNINYLPTFGDRVIAWLASGVAAIASLALVISINRSVAATPAPALTRPIPPKTAVRAR